MKIAVSAIEKNLDSQIDPRFGRCACFVIVDPETMAYEAFENESMSMGGGAGIQSAQFVASKGAKVVITGNVGPNAVRTLSAAGVEVVVGQAGNVRQAIEDYKSKKLKTTGEANVADHFGMNSGAAPSGGMGGGMGRGMGGGMGRGMGGGMGRGMGGGMGRGMGGGNWAAPQGGSFAPTQAAPPSREDEMAQLKADAEALRKQMEAIESRMRQLDKK